MSTQTGLKKVRASVMNAVHDLAVLVARDEGLFVDQGDAGARSAKTRRIR